MRSNQLITGALAVVATSGLIGLAGAASAAEPTTSHERGNVLECSGTFQGKHVFASLYENSLAGNQIQVAVDDGAMAQAGRWVDDAFIDGRQVRGAIKLDGRRAVITGTAKAVGKKRTVHEVQDDGGELITIDGTHRRLATDLTMTWKGRSLPLDCDDSFAYALTVTREPSAG